MMCCILSSLERRLTPQSNKTTLIGRMYTVGISLAALQVFLLIVSTGLNLISVDNKASSEKWMDFFNKYDKDKDCVLGKEELTIAFRALGITQEEKIKVIARSC